MTPRFRSFLLGLHESQPAGLVAKRHLMRNGAQAKRHVKVRNSHVGHYVGFSLAEDKQKECGKAMGLTLEHYWARPIRHYGLLTGWHPRSL